MSLEQWTCAECGTVCERVRVKGQKPKWCSQRCADLGKKGATRDCYWCGSEYYGVGPKYCSRSCAARAGNALRPPAAPKVAAPPTDRRSPLRRALESGDRAGVIEAIRADVERDVDGCWNWKRKLNDGYPEVRVAGRYYSVHRLALEAALGGALGSQQAHHICANSQCVNPSHLQPVTHRDNAAEMLARRSLTERIAALEDALASLAPDHELLKQLPVA